jgi:hypothetical protein
MAPTVSFAPRIASIATGFSDPVAGWELYEMRQGQGLLRWRDAAWGDPFPGRRSSVYDGVFQRLVKGALSMSMAHDQDAVRPVTLQGQIIVGALLSGVLIFLVIAAVIDLQSKPDAGPAARIGADGRAQPEGQPDQSVPILTYIALAVGAVCLPMSLIVPNLVAKQQRLAIAGGKSLPGQSPAATPAQRPEAVGTAPLGLPGAYLNQLIVGAAMNEGAAFFSGVAFLVEKNPIALAVALVLLAGLIARFPTASRVERWIEQQQEKLREDRLQSPSAYWLSR